MADAAVSRGRTTTGGGAAPGPVTVVLADDQALMRMGFRMVLDAEEGIEVVGEASDGASALAQARAAAITAQCPGTKILILTTFDLDEYAFAGLRAGASGFLLKDTRPAELAEAIRTVAGGEAVVSPRITRRMLEMFASHLPEGGAGQAQEDPRIASLTPREREILILMAQGMSNAEIAADLVVSSTTVKTHVGNVLTKLNVRDRVQAVVVAYETGLMA